MFSLFAAENLTPTQGYLNMSYVNPNVLSSGTTFSQFQAAGASGHLERLIAANAGAELNPTTAATLSANAGGAAGGLLPPGVYYLNFTESNGYGETLPSAESGPVTVAVQAPPTGTPTVVVSGSGGTLTTGTYFGKFTYVDSNLNSGGVHGETTAGTEFTFTQVGAAQPAITINDGGLPAWASGRNLYLTAAGGSSGSEVLASTGIVGSTYTITANPPASTVAPPATNSTSTNIPKVTAFPALQSGNIARNIYLTGPGGGSGNEVLYAREQTAATFTLSAAAPGSNYAVPLPTTNTTAYQVLDYQMLRSLKTGNIEDVYRRARELIVNFNRGAPLVHSLTVFDLKRIHMVFATVAQLFAEMGSLVEANPGHLGYSQTGIGGSSQKRTWP
jgi:hypothetical protein